MGIQQSSVGSLVDHLSLVGEISNIHYDKGLGSSRFLKCIRAKHDTEGTVILKVFQKPEGSQVFVHSHVLKQQKLRAELLDVPNVMPYQSIQETERAVYLLRQYLANNLYDRISTRPFLTNTEKRWITFQLLSAVCECHARRIYHGDLKTENVLLTNWNWIFLSDFADFKPVLLPEDNPSDFSYYFDSSSRRTCYVAPERFENNLRLTKPYNQQELTAEMDIFSLGCVIAELFLEGTPIFTFPQLLLYRKGEYDPSITLQKIEDEDIRSLIHHMIQLNPTRRYPIGQYLKEWKHIFPEYFVSFLYQYMIALSDTQNLSGVQGLGRLNTADYKINRIYYDFDKIAFAFNLVASSSSLPNSQKTLFPLRIAIPNYTIIVPDSLPTDKAPDPIILVSLICSCIRNLSLPVMKLRALELLLALGIHTDDDLVLDRMLPYIVALFQDEAPHVRARAVIVLAQLLICVQNVTKTDFNIFPEYLFPNLAPLTSDTSISVRVNLALCIHQLAENALRFLEYSSQISVGEIMDAESQSIQQPDVTYDSRLKELHEAVQEIVLALLMDQESVVKRTLLPHVAQLCPFFGRQKSNDVVLSHIITYLNDKDWMLRSAFFDGVVGVGAFVGRTCIKHYIFPLMIQSLYDQEEFVVERVLAALRSLVELGLLDRMRVREFVMATTPILFHPNRWLRNNVIQFLDSVGRLLNPHELFYLIYPLLKAFLLCEISELTSDKLMRFTKPPLPRTVYSTALRFFQEFRARQEAEASMRKSSIIHALNFSQYDLASYLDEQGITLDDKDRTLTIVSFLSKVKTARPPLAEAEVSPPWHSWEPPNDPLINMLHHIGDPSEWVPTQTINLTPKTVFLTNKNNNAADQNLKLIAQTSSPQSNRSRRQSGSPRAQSASSSRSSPTLRMAIVKPNYRNSDNLTVDPPRIRASSSLESVTSPARGVDVGMVARSVPSTSASDTLATAFIEQAVVSNRLPQIESEIKSPVVFRTSSPSKPSPANRMMLDNAGSNNHEFMLMDRLLERKSTQAFPPDLNDFGKQLKINPRQPRKIGGKIYNIPNLQYWHPKGILVSNYTEHTAAVNMLAMAPDHSFFASCSDDSTVKIWDSIRLEKNVTNRARVTYNAGSAVRCISFCEQTFTIAAAHSKGIDVFRVDYVADSVPLPQYGKNRLIRQIDTEKDSIQAMDQFSAELSSPLIFVTDKNAVYGHDLRLKNTAWVLQVPPKYGVVTAMAVDKINHAWITLGTHKGILTVLDIRFQIPLKSWLHPSQSPIQRLTQIPHHERPQGDSVMCAAGRNELTVWDLQRSLCTEVLCARNLTERVNRYARTFTALELPRFEIPTTPVPSQPMDQYPDPSIRCFTFPLESSFIITGGEDRKLRFWDLRNPERSRIVSGLKDDFERQYSCSRPTESMIFFHEKTVKAAATAETGVSRDERSSVPSKTPLTKQLSSYAESGYQHHIDCINDVAFTELPHPMIISAGRDGVIKVWK